MSQPSDLDSFRAQALTLLEKAAGIHTINEASTEMELIRPLLKLLSWNHYLPQQGIDQKPIHPRPSALRRCQIQRQRRQ
ncbi:MAG: hypothetical protein OXO50_18345 [Caldilineaceae bacterium]|nr:hypothetical protein [Caldilineaceae bacterium]